LNNTRKIGNHYETQCITYLKKNNFFIKQKNYISAYGEIDIIAEKNNIINFIEVKSGKSNFENLLYKLNSTKQKKIIKTALDYLTKNNINNTQINFIYMIVYKNKIRYYDNAIPLDLNKI
tara:strand:- start:550 stop:909 length:360 start_codon:yes stop_codon:yes gene_type:complete